MGWIVHRQAILYAANMGGTAPTRRWPPKSWRNSLRITVPSTNTPGVAEKDGDRVGAVFVAKESDQIAKLRLLHVERQARGLGIGKRLVEECIRFARQAGYQKMTLWTQSILHAARHIYENAGFQVVHEEKHHSFGKDLTAETWELDLTTTA
jgi:GNAT superfamily N-acetyltransferase